MLSSCSYSHCVRFSNSSQNILFTEWRVWKLSAYLLLAISSLCLVSNCKVFLSYQYSFHHQSESLQWCRTGMCWASERTSELPQNSLLKKTTVTLICLKRVLNLQITIKLPPNSFEDDLFVSMVENVQRFLFAQWKKQQNIIHCIG